MTDTLLNEQIVHSFPNVRVATEQEQLGVMTSRAALDIAEQMDLDLILVAEKADPPVCKILDFSKFRYEAQKKEKEFRRRQAMSQQDTKEIKLRQVTNQHDLEVKAKQANKFLLEGDKVKISVEMKGRERSKPELSIGILNKFIEMLPNGSVERSSHYDGRAISATVQPKKE